MTIPRCHCGRKGQYAGKCYWHAEGLHHCRSKVCRKGAETAKARRVKLCGAGRHAMTPENIVMRGHHRRCRACAAEARMRYQRAHAAEKRATPPPVAPYVPKRPKYIAAVAASGSYAALMAAAAAEYQAWRSGVALEREEPLPYAEVA